MSNGSAPAGDGLLAADEFASNYEPQVDLMRVYPSMTNFFDYTSFLPENNLSNPDDNDDDDDNRSNRRRRSRVRNALNEFEGSICCSQCPIIIQSRVLIQFSKYLIVIVAFLLLIATLTVMGGIISWGNWASWTYFMIMIWTSPGWILFSMKLYVAKQASNFLKLFLVPSGTSPVNATNIVNVDLSDITKIRKYAQDFHTTFNKYYYSYITDVMVSFLACFWFLLELYDECLDDIYSGGGKDGNFINEDSGFCKWVASFRSGYANFLEVSLTYLFVIPFALYVIISSLIIWRQIPRYVKMQQLRIHKLIIDKTSARIGINNHNNFSDNNLSIPFFLFDGGETSDTASIRPNYCFCQCCETCCSCACDCCECCNNCCSCNKYSCCECCKCRRDCCNNNVKCGLLSISVWNLIISIYGAGWSLYGLVWILAYFSTHFNVSEYMPVFYIWIGTYLHLNAAMNGIALPNYLTSKDFHGRVKRARRSYMILSGIYCVLFMYTFFNIAADLVWSGAGAIIYFVIVLSGAGFIAYLPFEATKLVERFTKIEMYDYKQTVDENSAQNGANDGSIGNGVQMAGGDISLNVSVSGTR